MKSKTQFKIESLRNISLFEDLSDKSLKDVVSLGIVSDYGRNEIIVHERELDTNIYFILSGKVKVSKVNKDGRELTLAMLSENDFFGELAAIDGMPRAATVTTLSNSTVFYMEGGKFFNLVIKESKISIALIKALANRIRKTDDQINSMWLNGACNKIAAALIRIAEDFGKIKQGTVNITGFASHKNIASCAGVTRETCSRSMAIFEREGFIVKSRNNVMLVNYDIFKKRFGI